MILQERIKLLTQLGHYLTENDPEWMDVKERAFQQNQWFIPEFIDAAVTHIIDQFLQEPALNNWAEQYQLPEMVENPQSVGIVMAGNIPLVGFHDLLCVFISGHQAVIKASSKDDLMIKFLVKKLYEWELTIQNHISFTERLNNLNAYIATGSNNSSRYFEYYFGKYPHIIRKNRTSIAILDGTETKEELAALADDTMLFFGLGCRNITQVFVPEGYDFIPLLTALKKYEGFMEYHKYKNNFDYHLALLIMGGKYYMNNDTVVLTENISPFSPVSQLHYSFYTNKTVLINQLKADESIQCMVGHNLVAFGSAQKPALTDYADGVDTMKFLRGLTK
ncbi:MAG: acyl-CoA reductase [Sphingobacteriia bacterium]|nr:MAG: acyl-CoA reductase [Sphingobacteriia bacterium]